MVSSGVCIVNELWQPKHEATVTSIAAAGFKIKITKIIPDLIVSSRGVSVAFIYIPAAEVDGIANSKERIQKMAGGFQFSYILSTLGHDQQSYTTFAELCFTCAEGSPGKPAVLAVTNETDLAQSIVSIVGAHADCKEQGTTLRFLREMEEFVQSPDAIIAVLTTIPGIDVHEAHSLMDGVGSLTTIASSTADYILRCTDLSPEQARSIEAFFQLDVRR